MPGVQHDPDPAMAIVAATAPSSDSARVALIRARRELQFVEVIVRHSELSDIAQDRIGTAVDFVTGVLDAVAVRAVP